MKKIIACSFVLSTLLGTTPQISTLTNDTKIYNETHLQKLSPISTDFEYIKKYFNAFSVQKIQELKENLLSAIGLKNGSVIFDSNKLNKNLWNLKIYQIITSKDYLQVLNLYFQNKLLIFDIQGKSHFNFSLFKNIKMNGIWWETYWYWFGYWRLHLTSSAIEAFIDGGTAATEIAQQIAEIPGLDIAAIAIAEMMTLSALTLKYYDYGNGSWVSFFAIAFFVPLDFGSN